MLPADHHIARPEAFREALAEAARLAETGHIVTIGIRPHAPETGYGYLKVGARLPGKGKGAAPSAHKVERFVEKPDVVTAARYLADGHYLWNSGIFVFRADVILEEIRRAMPVLGEQLDAIQQVARHARPTRRRWPGSSPTAPPSPSTTASWRRASASWWCRPTSAGATWAASPRSPRCARPTTSATWPRATPW